MDKMSRTPAYVGAIFCGVSTFKEAVAQSQIVDIYMNNPAGPSLFLRQPLSSGNGWGDCV